MNTLELAKMLETDHDTLKKVARRIGEGENPFVRIEGGEVLLLDNVTSLYIIAIYTGNLDNLSIKRLFTIEELSEGGSIPIELIYRALINMGLLKEGLITVEGLKYGRMIIPSMEAKWYGYLFNDLLIDIKLFYKSQGIEI